MNLSENLESGKMNVHFNESKHQFTREQVENFCKSIVCNKVERFEVYWSYYRWDRTPEGEEIFDKRPVIILGETKMEKEIKGETKLIPAYSVLPITHVEELEGSIHSTKILNKSKAGLDEEDVSEISFPNILPKVEKRWLRTYSGRLSISDIEVIKPVLDKLGW